MQGNLYYGIISVAGLELKMGCTLNQVVSVLREYIRTIKKYEYNDFYMEQDSNYYEVFLKSPVQIGDLQYITSLVFDKEKQVLRKYKFRQLTERMEIYQDRRSLEVELGEEVEVDDFDEAVGISYDNDYVYIREVYDKLEERYDFAVNLKYDKFKKETVVEFKGDLARGVIEYNGLIFAKGTKVENVEEVLEDKINEAKEFSILDEASGITREYIEITLQDPIIISGYRYLLQVIFDLDTELLMGYRLIYAEGDRDFNKNHNMIASMIGLEINIDEYEDSVIITYDNNEISLYSEFGKGYEDIFLDIDLKYDLEQKYVEDYCESDEVNEREVQRDGTIAYDEVAIGKKVNDTEKNFKKDIKIITYALVVIVNITALIVELAVDFFLGGIVTQVMSKAIQTGLIAEIITFIGIFLIKSIPGLIVIIIGYFVSLAIIKNALKLEVDRKSFKNRYTYSTMIAIVIIWALMMFL